MTDYISNCTMTWRFVLSVKCWLEQKTQSNIGAMTNYADMHPLVNDYCIEKTTLGGDFFGNSEE